MQTDRRNLGGVPSSDEHDQDLKQNPVVVYGHHTCYVCVVEAVQLALRNASVENVSVRAKTSSSEYTSSQRSSAIAFAFS